MTDFRDTLLGSLAVGGELVFDDGFRLLSFALDSIGLVSLEVMVRFEGRTYSMEIVTVGVYVEQSQGDESEEGAVGEPYLISEAEILPSELVAIKRSRFEELARYLVEQG